MHKLFVTSFLAYPLAYRRDASTTGQGAPKRLFTLGVESA